MSSDQASAVRTVVTEELVDPKDWTCSSSDDESYSDQDYVIRASINRRPRDEDIEASRYWTLSRLLKQGLWKTRPYSKEEIKRWKDSQEMWKSGKRKWSTRVEKPAKPLEGWDKYAHEHPENCKIRLR